MDRDCIYRPLVFFQCLEVRGEKLFVCRLQAQCGAGTDNLGCWVAFTNNFRCFFRELCHLLWCALPKILQVCFIPDLVGLDAVSVSVDNGFDPIFPVLDFRHGCRTLIGVRTLLLVGSRPLRGGAQHVKNTDVLGIGVADCAV